ncbi:hypothetical protein [Streptomyces qinglanensis]|uniref:DUF3558 domain-containing protein n=1 Tax=Streptomyces qinglanensis TaxID=943816 RepID=A0A1H9WV34_9ACTN|nr:hypothetical protein [Streptomyces qinglanensis]SES37273.1 hypothetical protein SAMN05421870_120126 [Streptomyces qinglanensis]
MPRRAKRYATRAGFASYATSAALVLALAGTVTGCTGSSGGEDDKDGKPGSASASPSAAAPGKYDSLPEPCGTAGRSRLRDMLPGAAAAEDESGEENTAAPSTGPDPLEGEASATYDTDRSVGCRWKSATTVGTRHLSVQFERVVSYDPSISDDEQAERLYGEKARKAGISGTPGPASGDPSPGKTPDGHASPTAGDDEPDSSADPDEAPDETPSPTAEEDVAPRPLEGIGDAAYLDDALHTADSGLHRDITLVFRTANVIATVEYDQWVTDKHRIPDSHELQKKARKLAEQLAGRFEED